MEHPPGVPAPQPPETSYDRVPYKSFPFPQTHPGRLACGIPPHA